MGFLMWRVRGGEWIVGLSSLALLVVMFFVPWYGLTGTFAATAQSLGQSTSSDGWVGVGGLRWLLLLVILVGLLSMWFQATRPAPALAVSFTVAAVPLATLAVIGLIFRVLIDPPSPSGYLEVKGGAYAGLVLSIAILVGAYVSLREDGIHENDAPQSIETLRLAPRPSRR
jgi:hypothetical protein